MKNLVLILVLASMGFTSLFSQYVIEEKTSLGSCISYSLKDLYGADVVLPQQVNSALACSPNTPLVSVGSGILFYFYESAVYSLDIASGVTHQIVKISKSADGLSDFILNETQNCLAFVSIEQDSNLEARTNLSVILLEGAKKKTEWNQELKLNYFCDGNCSSIAGRDFWFEEENTLGFFVWTNRPYDNEGAGKEMFWKLF